MPVSPAAWTASVSVDPRLTFKGWRKLVCSQRSSWIIKPSDHDTHTCENLWTMLDWRNKQWRGAKWFMKTYATSRLRPKRVQCNECSAIQTTKTQRARPWKHQVHRRAKPCFEAHFCVCVSISQQAQNIPKQGTLTEADSSRLHHHWPQEWRKKERQKEELDATKEGRQPAWRWTCRSTWRRTRLESFENSKNP